MLVHKLRLQFVSTEVYGCSCHFTIIRLLMILANFCFIFVAWVGLEPTTPLWGAPAYETGEIPTSRPRDFKNLCLFQSVTALKDLFYLRSKQLPVNLSDLQHSYGITQWSVTFQPGQCFKVSRTYSSRRVRFRGSGLSLVLQPLFIVMINYL